MNKRQMESVAEDVGKTLHCALSDHVAWKGASPWSWAPPFLTEVISPK